MGLAKKGDWVRIHTILLQPEERAPQVPEDTKNVPLEMWVKGRLINEEAPLGSQVSIKTLTGRIEKGELVEINPVYRHGFGEYVDELSYIGPNLRKMIQEVD